jgi:4-amino-4-deoxy-L-arabinose transferase-like glycosyltransferase
MIHRTKKQPAPLLNAEKGIFERRLIVILLLIGLLAAVLRLARPGLSPPGANQDEVANAWNAWCLLKTGTDQNGDPWPIFYSRCLGEYRTTLYYYFLMPFQLIGGFNIITMRLPNMVGGVIGVFLIYSIGSRLFDKRVGLLAALLLALNPWHLQNSRWGHEAGISSLMVLLSFAAILKARLPLVEFSRRQSAEGDRPRDSIVVAGGMAALRGGHEKNMATLRLGHATPPSPVWSAIAGCICGISCYGYPAIRLFLPAVIFIAILNRITAWASLLKTRARLAVILYIVSFAATFGPLVYKHLAEPEIIAKRSQNLWCWLPDDSTGTKIIKVLKRYPPHFGPEFLFISGDPIATQTPYLVGQFHWYMAVLMPAGLVAGLWRWRKSAAARLIIIMAVCYPLGDLLNHSGGPHSLRSSPGLPGLILLGAVGGVAGVDSLRRKVHGLAAAGAILILVAAGVYCNALHLQRYFTQYNLEPKVRFLYLTDLHDAANYAKAHYDQYDAVVCTTTNLNMPYLTFLLALNYDPHEWFSGPREFKPDRYTYNINLPGTWDLYTRVGKLYFMYDESYKTALQQLRDNGKPDKVLFILHPQDKTDLTNPIHKIIQPGGKTGLLLYELTI